MRALILDYIILEVISGGGGDNQTSCEYTVLVE